VDTPSPGVYGRSVTLLRTAFANPALARVLCAWAASSLSVWAFTILFALAAYDAGGTTALGLAVTLRTLPAALGGPYGAVLADRYGRRDVLLLGLVGRAALLAALGLALTADAGLVAIGALGALFTLVGVAHKPAQSALMTALARTPAELAAANVLTTSLEYAGFLSGSLLVAAAAGLLGVDVAMFISVVPLVAATVVILGVARDRRPEALPDAPAGVVPELLGGIRAVTADRGLTVLTAIFAADMFVQGLIDVLLVVVSIEALGAGQSGVGWLNAGWGVGGLLGGAAALVLLGRGQLSRGLALACVVAGTPFALVAATGSLPPAIALLVIVGVGFAVMEIALVTFTQRLAPDDVLGRVFGVQETLLVGCAALGSLVASGSVSLVGLEPTVVMTGLLLPVLALVLHRPLFALEAEAAVPEHTFALLRAVPLFAPLPIARVETLALRASTTELRAGETVVQEGNRGDEFYVIDTGTVDVSLRGAHVITRGPGEFFGEIALIRDTPRTATVRAAEAVQLVVVERAAFLDSIGAHPRCTHTANAVADARLLTVVEAAGG
jgi:predicted MFS family arabinose efflux permease